MREEFIKIFSAVFLHYLRQRSHCGELAEDKKRAVRPHPHESGGGRKK
jgi:hypothetical protein